MRAFVDYCIQLLNEETDFSGKVSVIQPIRMGMIEHLQKQNGQYHVFPEGVLNGKEVRSRHLINCLGELIDPYKDYPSFLKLAENENLTFIFSNTTLIQLWKIAKAFGVFRSSFMASTKS